VTLFFSAANPLHEAAILIAFVLLAVAASVFAVRSIGRTWNLLERTLETSGQLAIRLTVVIVFALVALASSVGQEQQRAPPRSASTCCSAASSPASSSASRSRAGRSTCSSRSSRPSATGS
jgi:hypothetical protein